MTRPAGRRPAPGGGQVSLARVAAKAGVAPVTVSRVLNTPDKVAPATRARVQAVMERLGYVPDLVASSLASRRSRVVALLVETLSYPMLAGVIQGLAEVLREIGYHLVIAETSHVPGSLPDFVVAMLGRRPEAIVVTGPVRDVKARRLLENAGIPVIQIWDLPEEPPVDAAIGYRNADAARAMAEHLLARGYRRIGFMGFIGDARSRERAEVLRACLAERGLVPMFQHVPNRFDPRYDATEDFLRVIDLFPDTDAVFCDTDVQAQQALLACLGRGWAIPGRIAISGFGDFPLSARLVPSLTSVRVHPERIGRRAGEIIVTRLRAPVPRKRPRPSIENLGFEIMHRGST